MNRRSINVGDHPPRSERGRAAVALQIATRLAAALLLFPATLGAQPHDLTAPVESPVWWTLSDDVTPAELKRHYSDRSLSLERYETAVELGLEEPLDTEQRKYLKVYVNRRLTPELEPMWSVFDVFARARISREGIPEEVVPRELREDYGISAQGVETIMITAKEAAAEHAKWVAEVGPKQMEMQRILRELYEPPGPDPTGLVPPAPRHVKRAWDATYQRDYAAVAAATGRPVSEIRELVDALASWWDGTELIAEFLPVLKGELSSSDWQRFRRYLREAVAARMGALKHFDEDAEETGE